MKKHLDTLKKSGFQTRYVTAEEREDGVGVETGLNLVKNGVHYTYEQACREAGIAPKRSEQIETLNFSVPNRTTEITDEIALAELAPKLQKYAKTKLISSHMGQYEGKYFWSGKIKVMCVWEIFE